MALIKTKSPAIYFTRPTYIPFSPKEQKNPHMELLLWVT